MMKWVVQFINTSTEFGCFADRASQHNLSN